MSVELTKVTYACDWVLEDGTVCVVTEEVGSHVHEARAQDLGWGWYENAHIRWEKWGAGHRHWFCPVHATQFRNNHGWGSLEDFGPPTKWWKSIFKSKEG